MDAQFSLTRTWLVFVLLYNSAQCLRSGADAVLNLMIEGIVTAAEHEAPPDEDINWEQVNQNLRFFRLANIGAGAARVVSVAILVWLFWWRKVAFWAYCASVFVNFTLLILSFESFWIAALDVVGLAGFVALMLRIEPGSWELLD